MKFAKSGRFSRYSDDGDIRKLLLEGKAQSKLIEDDKHRKRTLEGGPMPTRLQCLIAAMSMLVAASFPLSSAQAETAEIIEMFNRPMPQGWVDTPRPVPPAFERSGWSRPDFLVPLFAGTHEHVPVRGLENIGYATTLIGHLSEACGRLDSDVASFEMLPWILSGGIDAFQRMFEGNLTGPETIMMVGAALTTFSERQECRVSTRAGQIERELVQNRCSAAREGLNALGLIVNSGAARDAKLFLSRYSCESPQTLWLEENLVSFSRNAHRILSRPATLPSLQTAEGRVYNEILGNCLRAGWGEADENYCRCFVGQLYRADPPRDLIDRLALDPFITSRTWQRPAYEAVADTSGLLSCLGPKGRRLNETRAPRSTACLIEQTRSNGMNVCTYRAAWGKFRHTTPEACRPEYSSRHWGSDVGEVICDQKAGSVVAPRPGPTPRVWMNGRFQMVDFEDPVPDGFTPNLSDLVDELVALTSVRFLTRERTGQLQSMTYEPFNLNFVAGIDRDLAYDHSNVDAILLRTGHRVLQCYYKTGRNLVRRVTYWYESVPEQANSDIIPVEIKPAIDAMSPARVTCPPTLP